MKPARDMRELFADLPEAIANTMVVAPRCAVAAPKRQPILPSLPGEREVEAAKTREDPHAGPEMRLAKAEERPGSPPHDAEPSPHFKIGRELRTERGVGSV